MNDTKTAPQPGKRFRDLTLLGKMKFLGKVVVFAASFGFAFPTLFSE